MLVSKAKVLPVPKPMNSQARGEERPVGDSSKAFCFFDKACNAFEITAS